MADLKKTFEKWGYTWETCMENDRPLHPSDPRYYINKDNVIDNEKDNTVELSIQHDPAIVNWYNSEWTAKINYYPKYSCGLIKSVETVPVNSIIEAKIKFPKGNNLWPSFWLTACDDWPPEIDIVEAYSNKKGDYRDSIGLHCTWPFIYREYRLETNVHYKTYSGQHLQSGAATLHKKYLNLPLEDNWNHFKCEWTENHIKFYVNDNLIRTISDPFILKKMKTDGMWVIFNVWPNKTHKTNEACTNMIIKDFKVTSISK